MDVPYKTKPRPGVLQKSDKTFLQCNGWLNRPTENDLSEAGNNYQQCWC